MTESIIKLVTHPHAWELYQSRRDESIVTGQPMVENPYWFKNTETGQLYYDLFACIGWPTEVTDKEHGLPGYAAIVGIVRPDDLIEHTDPANAVFQLLEEAQSSDIHTLLDSCLDMREKYGYGCQDSLLKVWYGDPDRFLTSLALYNEKLTRKHGNENYAILITPPEDFYSPMVFDNYVRSFRSCLLPGRLRFYYGGNDILRKRIGEFYMDDPTIMAIGGLIHSLLTQVMWMGQGANIYNIEEEEV